MYVFLYFSLCSGAAHYSCTNIWCLFMTVIGTLAMNDYLEAGTIVFLFTIAEWLESRASHKVPFHSV
jgi:cation transport ATPase